MKKLLLAIITAAAAATATTTAAAEELRLIDATGGAELTILMQAAMQLTGGSENTAVSMQKSVPSKALPMLESGRADAVILDHRFAGKYQNIALTADALAICASTANPVRDLTVRDVQEIITLPRPTWKKYINWDEDIQRIAIKPGRPGGTLLYRIFGKQEFPQEIFRVTTPDSGFAFVNSASLFFVNFRTELPSNIKMVRINGVYPTGADIRAGRYPLAVKYVIAFKSEHPLLKKLINKISTENIWQRQMQDSGLLVLLEKPVREAEQ